MDRIEDVRGLPLSPSIAERHVLAALFQGQVYDTQAVRDLVENSHKGSGGVVRGANQVKAAVKRALQDLRKKGLIEMPHTGYYRLAQKHATDDAEEAATDDSEEEENLSDELREVSDENIPPEDDVVAEVEIGTGSEFVYAWYEPPVRELAERNGEERFPMKVGFTADSLRSRLPAGYSSFSPVFGFIFRTDNARAWEKYLHACLEIKGLKKDEAQGNEWYTTYPDELKAIVELLSQDGIE